MKEFFLHLVYTNFGLFNFLYTNYEYYFLVIAGLLGSLPATLLKFRKRSVGKRVVYYISLFSWVCFWAIIFFHNFSSLFSFLDVSKMLGFLIKCGLCAFAGILFCFLFMGIELFYSYLKSAAFVSKNSYGIIVFCFLMFTFALQLPKEITSWCAWSYIADYSLGFGSRLMVGTILHMFYRDFLSSNVAYVFCLCTVVIIILVVSVLINAMLKSIKTEARLFVSFMVMLFLATPGSVTNIWLNANFGRLEIYGFLISLISILLFEWIKNIYIKYILITLLSCFSLAIYHGNIFMYYAIILMLITYDGLKAENHLFMRRILGLTNVLATGCTFLVFQFFTKINVGSATELVQLLSQKTDLYIEKEAIDFEFFRPLSDAYNYINIPFFSGEEFPREKTLFTFVILIPIIAMFLYLYLQCKQYRIDNKQKLFSLPYLYYVIIPFIIVPQFALNVDWGRWMLCITIVSFFGVFYLAYKREEGMLYALELAQNYIKKNAFLTGIVFVYITGLGVFNGRNFILESRVIETLFINLGWM